MAWPIRLIVHWPNGIGTDGETRDQYVHAIDVMPTLLDLIGIDPPDIIAGVTQSPIEGVSFAPTLTTASAPSAHITQYYEMLGSRALYHDGWKAVVFHTPPFINYDGTDTRHPFDDDKWELYHVAEDFAEVHDLAAERPEKLAELQQLWWQEAAKYQVLPLNNEPGRFGDRATAVITTSCTAGSVRSPKRSPRTSATARSRSRPRSTSRRRETTDGVIVAHGCHAGGYVAYLRDRRLHYAYNFVGTEITTVSAAVELPTGPVVARIVFTRAEGDRGGNVELFYDDASVGSGRVERTTLLTYGTPGFAVGYQPVSPIVSELSGRAELPPGILGRVVIDTRGRDPIRDPEARADLATQ